MANVKITALTNMAAADVDVADVFIIDDVSVPESKQITVANLRAAVDTIATSNINTVSSNVDAVEARRVANVTLFTTEDTALQLRLTTNVLAFTNEDTALQARITANNTLLHSNDFVTFTRLQSNIDLVQDNVASVTVGTAADTETRLNANLDITNDNVTTLTTTVDNFGTSSNTNAAALAAGIASLSSVDTATGTETRLNANLDITNDNVSTLTTTVDNYGTYGNTNFDTKSNVSATYIQLNSNINVVQDNVASIIDGTTAFTGDVTFEDTTDDSGAGPEFNLFRNSASPANADYLGQIKFQGKSDAGTTRLYGKVTGKISSVTNGSETGLIEVAVRDSGSNKITTRFKGDEIQTLNDVGLNIDGTSTFVDQVTMNDDLIVTGNLTVNGTTTTINTTNMDVDDTLIMLANGTTGSPANDIGILFNRGNQGNAAFFYDESSVTFKLSDTKDPTSNTSLSPVTSANLDVGILTAATITLNSADLGSNLAALAAGIAASGSADFPTGDYGLLDSANSSTDAFGVAVAGLTTFDMGTEPAGSLATEDLGALT